MAYAKPVDTLTYVGGTATTHDLSEQMQISNEIGEIIFIYIAMDGTKVLDSIPAGWTGDANFAATNVGLAVISQRATVANVTAPSITLDGADSVTAGYQIGVGAPAAGAYVGNVSTGQGNGSTATFGAIANSANSSVLHFLAVNTDEAVPKTYTGGAPLQAAAGNAESIFSGQTFKRSAGAGATETVDFDATDGYGWVSLELLDDGNGNEPVEPASRPVDLISISDTVTTYDGLNLIKASGTDPRGVALKATVTFDASSVDTGTDTITEVAHGIDNGNIYQANAAGGTLPTGVVDGDYYWIFVTSVDTFQLIRVDERISSAPDYFDETSPDNIVDITAAGSGTCEFQHAPFCNAKINNGVLVRSASGHTAAENDYGAMLQMPTDRDMTGERFYFRIGAISGYPLSVCFIDSTGDFKTWTVSDPVSSVTSDTNIQIDVDSDINLTHENGTFDVTSVRYVYISYELDDFNRTPVTTLDLTLLQTWVTPELSYGGGTVASDWVDILFAVKRWIPEAVSVTTGVDSQYIFNIPLQLGEGTNGLTIDAGSKAVAFVPPGDGVINKQNNISTLGVFVDRSVATTSISLSGQLLSCVDEWEFKEIATPDASSSFVMSITLENADVELLTGAEATASIFDGCPTVIIDGASLDNAQVNNTKSTNTALSAVSNDELDGTSIEVNDADYHLELGTGVTAFTLTNVSFIGTPDVDKVHVLATVGTVDITLDGTSLTLADITSDGATVNLIAPTADLTVNSSESGSLIQIFTTTTQTVLDSTTGTQLIYTHSSETVDIVVQKAGFIPQRRTGIVLSGNLTQDFDMIADLNYDASHGLVYTTDASWSRANNELTVPTFGPTGRGVYSLMIDSFISQATLRNTAFNLQMNGPSSLILINDAEGVNDATIENMTQCGAQYRSTSDAVTASWCGVDSSGVVAGTQVVFQQEDGNTWMNARVTGDVDEVIKIFGDASHGNFDFTDTLHFKANRNGYRPVEVDILEAFNTPALDAVLYVIALPQIVIVGLPLGDPSPTGLTLTDDSAAPVSWDAGDGAKDYSITVTDTGANTGETILRWLNYNTAVPGTFEGKSNYSWGEIVLDNGPAYESIRGKLHLATGDVLVGVRVIRPGDSPHPEFTRFQSDDGTYGTPPVTATATISNLTANSRIQIYNVTTDTEVVNAVNAGTSYTVNYTDGSDYTSGDTVRVRVTYVSGVTAKNEFLATTVATTNGWTIIADQVDNDVYNTLAVDGSTITDFTADYVNDEVDVIVSGAFLASEWYAWWTYNGYLEEGIREFFGGVTAIDVGNFRINNDTVNIFFDNDGLAEAFQNDNRRIYRNDGVRPVKNPTTSGFGVDIEWREPVLVTEVQTGAGADWTEAEKQQIRDAMGVNGTKVIATGGQVQDIKAKTDELTFTVANQLDANIQYVNDVQVTGDGEEGSEWGPV